jgi:hypothetical protein
MLVNRRIFGVSLNSRRNRRWLVVLLYVVMGVPFVLILLKHGGLLEGQLEFEFLFFPVLLINALLFGNFLFWGKRRGGLLKPFAQDPGRPNDERELAARDSAHYRSLRAIRILILLPLFLRGFLPFRYRAPTEVLFYTRMSLWGLWVIAMTLPQAIVLWSEPDIDSEPERQNVLGTLRHIR